MSEVPLVVGRLERAAEALDAEPVQTFATPLGREALDHLAEAIDAARRAADRLPPADDEVPPRLLTRFRFDLEVVHDGDPDELSGVLLARWVTLWHEEGCDVVGTGSQWDPVVDTSA